MTVHQLPTASLSPQTTLAPARDVPLPEQQYDVFFTAQAPNVPPVLMTLHQCEVIAARLCLLACLKMLFTAQTRVDFCSQAASCASHRRNIATYVLTSLYCRLKGLKPPQGDFTSPLLRLGYSSLVTPFSIIDVNMAAGVCVAAGSRHSCLSSLHPDCRLQPEPLL